MFLYKLRLPGATAPIAATAQQLRDGIVPPGFVIAPFDTSRLPVVTIPSSPQHIDCQPDTTLTFPVPDRSTTRDEHRHAVATAAAFHAANGGKTVISRVIKTDPLPDPDAAFDALADAYPDACVFTFDTPVTGRWIGASPELLLSADGRSLTTMALAGTRPAGTAEPWDDKNREEQQLVTDFIADTLRRHNLSPIIGTRRTRRAGRIEHLMTPISASIPDDWSLPRLKALLADLAPTPALGGFPRQESLRLIARLETHHRAYYGGYFGIVESPRRFTLFVNLRSALVTPGNTYLYVGGGITAKSRPDDEWTETERKSNTLLAVFSKK